jgi:hypothetical protein
MFIANKAITPNEWIAIEEAGTGDNFIIQNISAYRINFCVLDTAPTSDIDGGILLPCQQLSFKKVSGDLYMKTRGENVNVYIEKVE